MAADTREYSANDQTPVADAATGNAVATEPPKRAPKGVVLGPDGKPCRPCTSFAAWSSQMKSSSPKAIQQQPAVAAAQATPNECPADVETLGRSSWTLLHTIAATYPTSPTPSQQSDLKSFMGLFAKLYPCWVCAEDFQQYIKKDEVRANSRQEFGLWLCGAHNEVNKKLGKPVFDCSKWEERWRTGWKDGRCD